MNYQQVNVDKLSLQQVELGNSVEERAEIDRTQIEDAHGQVKDAKTIGYLEKMDELSRSLHAMLGDFVKTAVITHMHPANEEYKHHFQQLEAGIVHIQSELLSMSHHIQQDTQTLNHKMVKVNHLIEQERKRNRALKKRVGIAETQNNSAEELIRDYKERYDWSYLRNWAMALNIGVCLVLLRRL